MSSGNTITCFAVSVLLFASGPLLSGCAKPQPPAGPIVAKVGDEEILLSDFRRELQNRTPQPTPEQREAALQDLIRTAALYQHAKKAGFDNESETRALRSQA